MTQDHENDSDGICQRCGVSHKQELIDALPEIARFQKAEEWGREKEADEIFSTPLIMWTHSLAYGNQNHFMEQQQEEGVPPHAAVTNYVEMMMRMAFVVGVHSAQFYKERMNFPEIEVPDEWIASYVETQKAEIEERASDHAPDPGSQIIEAIRKTLEELGVDSDVEIMQLAEEDGRAIFGVRGSEKGDDATGMYL